MKKFLVILIACMLCLVGCSEKNIPVEPNSMAEENSTSQENTSGQKDLPAENTSTTGTLNEKYSIGDEVELGGIWFNIYKIDNDSNELYLLAKNNITTSPFSDDEHSGYSPNVYEGSLVEGYVNRFVDDLADKGVTIKSSGIIDKDDLYELGFKHSDGLSGLPYECEDSPEFVKYEKNYWVGGYCKYETCSWVYFEEKLDSQSCDDEYGVRPIIIIEPSEINKKTQVSTPNLTIKEIVDSDCVWTSEGGIHNPYDRFYFDCEKMLFTNIFESSEFSQTKEYSMKFIDEKTIQINGLMRGYEYPAEITIVSSDKLRIRFLDNKYNDGDYFLNKTDEEK